MTSRGRREALRGACASQLAWAVAVVLAATSAMAQDAQERARTILAGRAYGFCHDMRREPQPAELRYCDFIDASSACPAFLQACEALRNRRSETASPRAPSCAPDTAAGLVGASRTFFLAVLAVLVALVVWLVVRAVLRARRKNSLSDVSPDVDEDRPSSSALPSAPADTLWERALDAYAKGQWAVALHMMFASLLRRLDERGWIHVDPSRTNGEYVRECEPDDVRATLRETVREFESVRYGGREASASTFDRLRPRVEPIVRGLSVWVIVALATTGASSCGGRAGGLFGSMETSARGTQAVRELLTQSGIRARALVRGVESPPAPDRVLVLDADRHELEEAGWASLLQWVNNGGALVLAGRPDRWATRIGAVYDASGATSGDLVLSESYGGVRARVPRGAGSFGESMRGSGVAAFAETGNPYVVWVPRASGRILAFAGVELLTNGGLAVAHNATAIVAMMRGFAAGRDVYFVDDPRNESSNPLRSLSEAGLLPLVAHVLLLLTLFYLVVGRHFATPRDRLSSRRRAFAEHVRAVGGMYARARTSRSALAAYAAFVTERFRERNHGGAVPLVESVAARVGETTEAVDATMRGFHARTSDPASMADEVEDLRLIRKLNDWMMKL